MPRSPRDAIAFLLGLWIALGVLVPLVARADAAVDGLAALESALHLAVNRYRAERHLIPLTRRGDLDAVALAHSRDMAGRRYLSHRSPEGHDWVARLAAAGVSGFSLAGENVGLTTRSDPNAEVLRGWIRSAIHRANLDARFFNATGVGIARAPDGTLYYTQLYVTFPR